MLFLRSKLSESIWGNMNHTPLGKRNGAQDNAPKPLFELGRVVGTLGALRALAKAEHNPFELLHKHVTGDRGDLDVGAF